MNFPALIEAKRDGQALTREQIIALIEACTTGNIPDYQMAAMLMAVYFRGLDAAETRAWTLAMRDSGQVLKFPDDPRPLVDKHSTGGVGDKVSLVLAPLLACLGFRVPMISGRGLGITGGTLDKLESIPGFTTQLPPARIVDITQTVGCVICGQTEQMVPADRALYALRDVTGTVPSLSLMTASILSKKLAEGLQALVLDVKFGSAAFLPKLEQARELARMMVALGEECGVRTRALLTDMNTPLGRSAGNWLEVKEAVECLEGRGPADLQELVIDCAARLMFLTDRAKSLDLGRKQAASSLASRQPRDKWNAMLQAQGADLDAFQQKLSREHTAPDVGEITAVVDGYLERCDARIVGNVVRDLGGGRLHKNSLVNHDVGVELLRKPGQPCRAASPLARVHAPSASAMEAACARLRGAFSISSGPPAPVPLIAEII